MDNKPKKNWFKTIINILFLIFIVIYCLSISGYYESKLHEKTVYTNEQIKKFEEDVKNGEEIDINNYNTTEVKNYANNFTRLGDKVSNVATDVFANGFDNAWKIIKTLFW